MKNICIGVVAAMAAVGVVPAWAMEVTAGGTIHDQVSWSALKALIDNNKSSIVILNGQVTQLQDQLTKVKACGANKMIYAPDSADKDANDCIAAGSKGVDHIDLIDVSGVSCSSMVQRANAYVGHTPTNEYDHYGASNKLVGRGGEWIMGGDNGGDCTPMSNRPRFLVQIPKDADNKPIPNFYRRSSF